MSYWESENTRTAEELIEVGRTTPSANQSIAYTLQALVFAVLAAVEKLEEINITLAEWPR